MHEAGQIGFLASRLKFSSELYRDKPGKPRKLTSYSNSPKSTRWESAVARIWCDVITSAFVWANFWDIFPATCRRNLEWLGDKASVTQTRKFYKKTQNSRLFVAYICGTFSNMCLQTWLGGKLLQQPCDAPCVLYTTRQWESIYKSRTPSHTRSMKFWM